MFHVEQFKISAKLKEKQMKIVMFQTNYLKESKSVWKQVGEEEVKEISQESYDLYTNDDTIKTSRINGMNEKVVRLNGKVARITSVSPLGNIKVVRNFRFVLQEGEY